MPYYDYACSKCSSEFERFLSMAKMQEPLTQPCPECGSEGTVTQQVTAAAIGDPIRLGIKRPDSGWGDVLKKVQKAHPKGNWGNKKFAPSSGR